MQRPATVTSLAALSCLVLACAESSAPTNVETLTVPADGTSISTLGLYDASATVQIEVSGTVTWGGCDAVNCPGGGSCSYARLGDAKFHSDTCFTGATPTATSITYPIELYLDGAALPAATYEPTHVYTFSVPGNGGRFVFRYNDYSTSYGDNSGTFTVTVGSQP